MQANLRFLQQEEQVAHNCTEAWKAMRRFETMFGNMVAGAQVDQGYLDRRAECLDLAQQAAASLDLPASNAGDAVLLLDRLVCQRPDMYDQVVMSHASATVEAFKVLS